MPHAANAINTPMSIEMIYFFAAPVFSSSPRDIMYIIPTKHIPMTAMMAVMFWSIPITDWSVTERSPIVFSQPGNPISSLMPTISVAAKAIGNARKII